MTEQLQKVKINIDYLRPNSKIIYALYSIEGRKILDDRIILTPQKLEQIKSDYGKIVYALKVNKKGIISQKNLNSALDRSKEIIEEIATTEKLTKRAFNEAEKVIDSIINDLNSSEIEAINLLKNLKSYEEYVYQHSVNVGILASVFARVKGFSDDDIKFLAIGAYLLDIGLTRIDKYLLKKDSKYTPSDMQKMKQHPQFGYEILKNISGINKIVLQTVLFHHEKHNYKGYYQLPYDMLPIAPKIVSICDIYDALTTPRPYRNAISPTNALKFLVNSVDIHFDYDLISDFINHLSPLLDNTQSFYLKNDFCELNTKELAMIMDINLTDYMKPRVMVFCKFQRKKNMLSVKFYDTPEYINLEEDNKRLMTKIIDNKKHITAIRTKLMSKGLIVDSDQLARD
jgi:HD-GYP domain-containing protein (c-di-GMP phosphodiesterase class II)